MPNRKPARRAAGQQATGKEHQPKADQTDKTFAEVVKSLFKLIQVLHHLGIMMSQKTGPLTKGFQAKQRELKRFLKPACPSVDLTTRLEAVAQGWASGVTDILVDHYNDRVNVFKTLILSCSLSQQDFNRAKQIALSYAKKKFGRKLKDSILAKFEGVCAEKNCVTPACTGGAGTGVPVPTDTGTQRAKHGTGVGMAAGPAKAGTGASPKTKVGNASPIDSSATVFKSPFQYGHKQPSPVDDVPLPCQLSVSKPSTSGKRTFRRGRRSPDKGMVSEEWCMYNASNQRQRHRSGPTGESRQPSQQSVQERSASADRKSSPSKQYQEKSESNSVMANVPLQNRFSLLTDNELGLEFSGPLSSFMMDAEPISQSPPCPPTQPKASFALQQRASGSKQTTSDGPALPTPSHVPAQVQPPITEAEIPELGVPATPDRLAAANALVSLHMPDTPNRVAAAETLVSMHASVPPPSQPMHDAPNQGTAASASPSVHAAGLPSPTEEPHLPVRPLSATTPVQLSDLPAKKAYRPWKQDGTTKKCRWTLPEIKARCLVIGDSNLSRVSMCRVPNSVVQVCSFPGGNFHNIRRMLLEIQEPHTNVDSLVLSIGINERQNDTKISSMPLFRRMIADARKAFPNAEIHMATLQWDVDRIPAWEASCLNLLQQLISKTEGIKMLPPIESSKFQIAEDDKKFGIHWTEETANLILDSWIHHLN